MKKFTTTILSVCSFVCALSAFATSKTADFFTQNQTPILHASAQAQTVSSQTETQLLAPSSYEQYLPLTAPTDVAVTENYTAIADDNVIYVYDRTNDVYRKYTHVANTTVSLNKVTQLQFDDTDTLYFLDASTYLYTLDPGALTTDSAATATGFVCSTFTLHEGTIYFTNSSGGSTQISKTSLDSLKISSAVTLLEKLTLSPTLEFYDGELYYTDGGKYLHKIDPSTRIDTFVAAFPSELISVSISDNVLCCTTVAGDFFSYDLLQLSGNKEAGQTTPLFEKKEGFGSLFSFKQHVYAIKDSAVWQYSLQNAAFTAFEIGSASANPHRLNGATDVYVSGNRLFIADNGNRRISVYDVTEKSFQTPISATHAPVYLASDDKTLLAAGKTEAVLYDLSDKNYGAMKAQYKGFNGNLVGVATIDGTYYLATDKNQFVTLTQKDGVWTWSTAQKTSTRYPTLFTADVYGKLYVASGTSVYLYTEENFISSSGSEVCTTLPADAEKISIDYRGNLYALKGETLHKFVLQSDVNKYEAEETFELSTQQVYGVTPDACSFAFSLEENATYVLYKNNYLLQTSVLQLPTVKNIPVNGADERVFNPENTEIQVVKTAPGALIIGFDLNKLNGADVFPYLSFERSEKSFTALKLGETDVYNLLAIYDENTNRYATCLVYASSCEDVPTDEYLLVYETAKIGYATNDVSLYRFPYLSELLTKTSMQRGATLSILGEITRLDRAYYYVEYEDGTRGYVPTSYVTPTSGEAPIDKTPYGATESDTHSIWRMVYLLLSFGAICILVDYLLLRKPKNENQNDENN